MTAVPLFMTSAAKQIYHWLHRVAYDDMARQASGWVSDESRIEQRVKNDQPIKLDFGVPKKHRLNWIHRATHHLPH